MSSVPQYQCRGHGASVVQESAIPSRAPAQEWDRHEGRTDERVPGKDHFPECWAGPGKSHSEDPQRDSF